MPTTMRVEGIEDTFILFSENEREEYSKSLKEGISRGRMITPSEVRELKKITLSKEDKLKILKTKLFFDGYVHSADKDNDVVIKKTPETNSFTSFRAGKAPEQESLFGPKPVVQSPARKKRRAR